MTKKNAYQELVAELIESENKIPQETLGIMLLGIQKFIKMAEEKGLELTITPASLSKRQPNHSGYVPGING